MNTPAPKAVGKHWTQYQKQGEFLEVLTEESKARYLKVEVIDKNDQTAICTRNGWENWETYKHKMKHEKRWSYTRGATEIEVWAKDESTALDIIKGYGFTNINLGKIVEVVPSPQDVGDNPIDSK